MQQHQSEVRHLLSQHKNELEESIKMRDAEILKVREELSEERKRHSIEMKEANDEFLRKENIYKRDVKQKQEKRSELLNEEFQSRLREGKIKVQEEISNNRRQHEREIAEMKEGSILVIK